MIYLFNIVILYSIDVQSFYHNTLLHYYIIGKLNFVSNYIE